MYTKAQVINQAYSEIRISGITFVPSAANMQKALERLESMMALWSEAYAFDCGYNFQQTPDLANVCGPTLAYKDMMAQNLAVNLCPDFGKEPSEQLLGKAANSFDLGLGMVAQLNNRAILPPNRMPRGNGNTFRWPYYNRFAQVAYPPPVSYFTEYIQMGETELFSTDFSDVLKGASITAFAYTADPLLTVDDMDNNSPIIDYMITCPVPSAASNVFGPWQQLQITISTSNAQTFIRTINFGVQMPPVVGSSA